MAKEVYDPEVLLQEDFGPFLEAVLARLDRQLCAMSGGQNQPMGALEALSFRSGVPVRRIYGYVHGENTFIDLDIADKLLLGVDLYVELEFPESAFYRASEVRQAALEQTEMMDAWCRHRGWVMPAMGTKARRTMPGKIRRQAWKEAKQREAMLAERREAAGEFIVTVKPRDVLDLVDELRHEDVIDDAVLEELMTGVAA